MCCVVSELHLSDITCHYRVGLCFVLFILSFSVDEVLLSVGVILSFVCSAMMGFTVHVITFSVVQFLCVHFFGNKTLFLLPEIYAAPENFSQERPANHQS